MKMHNVEIEPFIKFIMELDLPGRESRMRTRFYRVALGKIKEIEEERLILVNKHGNLDNDGNVKKIKNDNGVLIWDIKNIQGFNDDHRDLLFEEWVLDNTEERKEMFLTLKNIVLNVDRTFKGQEALEYDRWCEIVETIKY